MKKSMIEKSDILKVQRMWADGIIKIGQFFEDNKNYKAEANKFIDMLYNYNETNVLFKPTLVSKDQFRLSKESALSYFVGGNSNFKEDSGFAIKGWKSIRFENSGIQIEKDIAMAMGNYFFIDKDNNETKVEYSFVYKINNKKNLVIILHDSHLPYSS